MESMRFLVVVIAGLYVSTAVPFCAASSLLESVEFPNEWVDAIILDNGIFKNDGILEKLSLPPNESKFWTELREKTSLLHLTASNFSSIVQGDWEDSDVWERILFPGTCALFYSPLECPTCTDMLKEFEAASTIVRQRQKEEGEFDDKYTGCEFTQFVLVNVDEEKHIAHDQDLVEYPTLKLFWASNVSVELRGSFNRTAIADWVIRNGELPIEFLKTPAEVAKFAESSSIAVVLFSPSLFDDDDLWTDAPWADGCEEDEDEDEDGADALEQQYCDEASYRRRMKLEMLEYLRYYHLEEFSAVARQLSTNRARGLSTGGKADVAFGFVVSFEIAEAFEVNDTAVLLFNRLRDNVVEYHGDMENRKTMRHFVEEQDLPDYVELSSDDIAAKIFSDERAIILLIADCASTIQTGKHENNSTAAENPQNPIDGRREKPQDESCGAGSVANHFKSTFVKASKRFFHLRPFIFLISGTKTPVQRRFLEQVAADLRPAADDGGGDVPSLWAIQLDRGVVTTKHKMLVLKENESENGVEDGPSHMPKLNVEDIMTFIDQIFNFVKPLHVRSDPIPESQNGPVYELVGSTFHEVVMKSPLNFFVMFYAPWCVHSQRLDLQFREAAQKLRLSNSVVFAKIDVSSNDVPLPIDNFPVLMFFPTENKYQPIKYDGERLVHPIIQFLFIIIESEVISVPNEQYVDEKYTDVDMTTSFDDYEDLHFDEDTDFDEDSDFDFDEDSDFDEDEDDDEMWEEEPFRPSREEEL